MNNKMYRLPKVTSGEVLGLMEADNISRMHLGLDPLPYLWYKNLLRLLLGGMVKFMKGNYPDNILNYCVATRKQRREIPFLREIYLLTMGNIRKSKKIEDMDKEIEKLNKRKK